MGFMDKVLDFLRLNEDDDDEYEFANEEYFEDEDDYEEPKKKAPRRENKVEVKEKPPVSKITPISKIQKKQVGAAGMEVCVIKPTTVDDAREITETLLGGSTVILNLEGLDLEVAQRIIDFTSGATFAINGNLQKISNFIFLVTPTNVDISGDLHDLLNSSFDVPSIKTRY